MNVKYGDTKAYKFTITDEEMKMLTSKTRRSRGQTLFLLQLIDGDIERLKRLEEQIKNCSTFVPGCEEHVEEIMSMVAKNSLLKFDE